MLNKKILSLLVATVLVGTLTVGCKGKEASDNKITVSGSTSVGPTMEILADKFKEDNSRLSIDIQQIGSSAGVKNAIDGTSEIGMSSRDLKQEEKDSGLEEVKIAIDGIAVITNKENKVKNLTKEQVKDIFTGKITNWSQVGGEDWPIVVVSREDGSGTRDGFQEMVGYKSEELTESALVSDGSGNINNIVKGNKNTIGYTSFGYVDDKLNALSIDNVSPTDENVVNEKYSIARPFIVVYKDKKTSENGKEFIDFILSEKGQDIISKNGFIKVK